MNKLEQVTQILYTATDYADALAKLAAINANVTTYQSYSVIDEFGLIFFASRNYQLPLVITFDGVSPSVTVEQYQAVYAQQQLELSKSVPAHDSPAAVEHLVIPEQSTESVDKPVRNWLQKHYAKLDMRKEVLRTDRRLRYSRVKGLSS
ncbi:pyruvate/2-oxoacid:ferredoxin oxidoreductase alpha subunit [Rheinheimera pacifica]|uniref:hypothetical protein n=1 Tax=Rheinheimera pacifica TaxID=173990 RepID=UPI0021686B70|nr:hypothetical protein [Rheinheimera pacifica]MCS4309018.1 pyruvate/2-oxoacid:ferredoxin oxidoreductase alpha subunit [Rheinheimera pacifica]